MDYSMVKKILEPFEFLQNLVFCFHEGNQNTSTIVINKSDKLQCIVVNMCFEWPIKHHYEAIEAISL